MNQEIQITITLTTWCFTVSLQDNMTINELKSEFLNRFDVKDQDSYECQDISGNSLKEEDSVYDIIQRTDSSDFKLVKVLANRENNLIEQQNIELESQEIEYKEAFRHRVQDVQKLDYLNHQSEFLSYRKSFWQIFYKGRQLFIPYVPIDLTTYKQLKKLIYSELITEINSDFFELQDERQCIIPENKSINVQEFQYVRKILVIDQEELMKMDPDSWKLCLFKQEQFNDIKQKNELFNLKFITQFWNKEGPAMFKVFPLATQMNISRIFFIGPKNTPYFGEIYELLCRIPEDYPYEPPQIYFLTQIYHPNIVNGVVQIKSNWKPTSTIEGLVLEIISYLRNPNLELALNKEAAIQYQFHRDTFNQMNEDLKKKFANPDHEAIVKSLIQNLDQFNHYQKELFEEFDEWYMHWVYTNS